MRRLFILTMPVIAMLFIQACDTLSSDSELTVSLNEVIKVKTDSHATYDLEYGLGVPFDHVEVINPGNFGELSILEDLGTNNYVNYKPGNEDEINDVVILEVYNDNKVIGNAVLTYDFVKKGENECGTFPIPTEYTMPAGESLRLVIDYDDILCEGYKDTLVGISGGTGPSLEKSSVTVSGGDNFIFESTVGESSGQILLTVTSFNTETPSIDFSKKGMDRFDRNEVVEHYPFLILINVQ